MQNRRIGLRRGRMKRISNIEQGMPSYEGKKTPDSAQDEFWGKWLGIKGEMRYNDDE